MSSVAQWLFLATIKVKQFKETQIPYSLFCLLLIKVVLFYLGISIFPSIHILIWKEPNLFMEMFSFQEKNSGQQGLGIFQTIFISADHCDLLVQIGRNGATISHQHTLESRLFCENSNSFLSISDGNLFIQFLTYTLQIHQFVILSKEIGKYANFISAIFPNIP